MMLLEEMASIFLTPCLLLFVVPKVILFLRIISLPYLSWESLRWWSVIVEYFLSQRVDAILHFIVDFTVHVEGVGHVCRLVIIPAYLLMRSYFGGSHCWSMHISIVKHWYNVFLCSFSVFDFQNHGNSKYGAPYNSARVQRSSQGKMEKSFLRLV